MSFSTGMQHLEGIVNFKQNNKMFEQYVCVWTWPVLWGEIQYLKRNAVPRCTCIASVSWKTNNW